MLAELAKVAATTPESPFNIVNGTYVDIAPLEVISSCPMVSPPWRSVFANDVKFVNVPTACVEVPISTPCK